MRTEGDTFRKVFGFAVRERDWPLAGLLAVSAGSSITIRSRLRLDLEDNMPNGERGVTLGALRALGRLLRSLAQLERERG
jgi:hypothetical protein